MARPPVTLVGASGFTGQLTARELLARGIPFTLAGRRRDRLEALRSQLGADLPLQEVDTLDVGSVAELFHPDLRCVISCAGPFIQLGLPLATACAERGVHCLDSTGEQAFIRACQERLDPIATRAVLCNAMAFEYALGDWLAQRVASGLGDTHTLRLYYRIDSAEVSRGTWLSMRAQRDAGSLAWEGGALTPRAMAFEVRRFDFTPWIEGSKPTRTVFIAFGEPVMLPRHLSVQNVWTYSAAPPKASSQAHLAEQEKQTTGDPHGPDAALRAEATFAIGLEAQTQDTTTTAVLTARDPYGMTAALLAWGAEQLLSPTYAATGVLTPAQAFDQRAAMPWLEERFGLSIWQS